MRLSVWREQLWLWNLTIEEPMSIVNTKTTDLDVCGVQVLIDTDSNVASYGFE